MCICVHCALVDRCTAYHTIEAKHGQPHLSDAPDFTPQPGSPSVRVLMNSSTLMQSRGATHEASLQMELDVFECADFVEERDRWVTMMPAGTLVKAGFDPAFIPT